MAAFLSGYVLVWTAVGGLAFLGDSLVHVLVDRSSWFADRPWLIGGLVLVAAGLFQFTELKDRCLEKCRNPSLFLVRRYRRGMTAAFELGRDHGLFCACCCWALMLAMFAAGIGNLWWMVALTALMVYEKTGPGGARSVPVTGVVFCAWGTLVLIHRTGCRGCSAPPSEAARTASSRSGRSRRGDRAGRPPAAAPDR